MGSLALCVRAARACRSVGAMSQAVVPAALSRSHIAGRKVRWPASAAGLLLGACTCRHHTKQRQGQGAMPVERPSIRLRECCMHGHSPWLC